MRVRGKYWRGLGVQLRYLPVPSCHSALLVCLEKQTVEHCIGVRKRRLAVGGWGLQTLSATGIGPFFSGGTRSEGGKESSEGERD